MQAKGCCEKPEDFTRCPCFAGEKARRQRLGSLRTWDFGERRKGHSHISPAEARVCQYVWLSAVEPAVPVLRVDYCDKPTWTTQLSRSESCRAGYE
jgi:hypothetical protein